MGEKQRGKDWLEQRSRHGGRRRGVFPTPAFTSFSQERAQSRQDKALLLQKIAELQAHVERDNGTDIGNKDLPAYQKKQEIIANIEAYKAIGLDGPTGSGKSTQLPQYLYEAGYDKTFVLVPRRIIADNLCDRIREEMQSHVGEQDVNEIVGIAHGERSEQHENNKIVIMTPNTYVRMAHDISSEFAEKKVAIISDEIHEANIYTEVATGVAAMSVKENDNWRLIAASATHNTGSLRHSLETLNDGYAPIVSIEGRPFDLDIREEPLATPMEVYRRIGSDHERTMIFTSGKAEIDYIIEKIKEELDGHIPGSSNQVEFRKLHGELREVELLHVADPVSDNRRLVIVSSPAGMSGITIPGVTLVITDGTINRSELDSDGVSGLERHFLSKGEIMQQFGRAGRDVPGGVGILAKPITVYEDLLEKRGVCVDEPAMPFRPFQLREEHAPPEIRNTNLSGVVLGVAVNDYSFADINSYIPHPVESSKIISAQEALYHLGAFDDDHRATESGRLMHRYPDRKSVV